MVKEILEIYQKVYYFSICTPKHLDQHYFH